MPRFLMILSGVVVVLATCAAAVGLHGSDVYGNDTLFFAEGFRGQDAVTLCRRASSSVPERLPDQLSAFSYSV
jgi:hypothetical protein